MASSNTGFAGRSHWWVDVLIGVSVIWLGCMGLDAMATATTVRDMDETDQSLATAVAEGERQRIENLDYSQLTPTQGFVAPSWIRNQDLEPGQVALVTQPGQGDVGESERIYSVTWKVEDVDRFGSIRRVTISVEWEKSNHDLGRVVLTTLRAGDHQA